MAKYEVFSIKGERRLEHHKGCQCKVRIMGNGTIEFISYKTVVIIATPKRYATIDKAAEIFIPFDENGNETVVTDESYVLECTGTYSPTTRKQIGYFLKEYFGDVNYYQMKDIAGTTNVVIANRKHARYW